MTPRVNLSQIEADGTAREKALVAALKLARERLLDCEEYFDGRADADCVGDPQRYVGNAEMTMFQRTGNTLRDLDALVDFGRTITDREPGLGMGESRFGSEELEP